MHKTPLLSSCYLPSIEYFACLAKAETVVIDVYEHYERQTERSRCKILMADGVHTLSVPVIKTNGHHTAMKDIRISDNTAWQRDHWRSIQTAYNKSPFFLYYQDDFHKILHKKHDFLCDLNMEFTNFFLKKINIKIQIDFSEKYIENIENYSNYRINAEMQKCKNAENISTLLHSCTSAFQPSTLNHQLSYVQVFGNEFVPNLSILDLLFNCGNESFNYLVKNLTV